ncbi:MBL fold metallo-hydrolase [Fulvivirga maritima]|uniref:MBL fold metallo-hydrolase n=1 Tax=Fulvivirga maritima TaxID=2904247 RepID=UPI001F326A83|nr:MBL fold metallo-hydrolase [Fulvivirga maritima]UII28584.1 MBL fold metallo-hydrolase [Fulvivirga maritima]
MIQIQSFVFNPFMENTYVVYDDETLDGVIIDPGCYEDYERNELIDFVNNNNIKVNKLLNTHCHIDHVLGNQFIKDTFNVNLYIHKADVPTLKSVEVYAPSYGFTQFNPSEADEYLEEGDTIEIGKHTFEVLFVPGHAPGHIAFVNHEHKLCISGDVLFQGSIGRTDLPGGDFDTLISSIHNKLFKWDTDYTVYSGHGGPTSTEIEKKSNPFCALKN